VPPEDGRLTPETCRGLRHNKVFVKVKVYEVEPYSDLYSDPDDFGPHSHILFFRTFFSIIFPPTPSYMWNQIIYCCFNLSIPIWPPAQYIRIFGTLLYNEFKMCHFSL
jgi:hypothetical protein